MADVCSQGGADNRIRVWVSARKRRKAAIPSCCRSLRAEGAVLSLTLSAGRPNLAFRRRRDQTLKLWNAADISERVLMEKAKRLVASGGLAGQRSPRSLPPAWMGRSLATPAPQADPVVMAAAQTRGGRGAGRRPRQCWSGWSRAAFRPARRR